ncbi:MAG: hypothetical protein COB50_05520 [Thiotrichales bacterium]|nr:MAG: hypothetical protein COB50_05520 [Thiotrichales bacterium]
MKVISIATGAVLLLFLLLLQIKFFAGQSSVFNIVKLKDTAESQRKINKELKAKNAALLKKIQTIENNPDVIGKLAHKDLDMLYPKELIYLDKYKTSAE